MTGSLFLNRCYNDTALSIIKYKYGKKRNVIEDKKGIFQILSQDEEKIGRQESDAGQENG